MTRIFGCDVVHIRLTRLGLPETGTTWTFSGVGDVVVLKVAELRENVVGVEERGRVPKGTPPIHADIGKVVCHRLQLEAAVVTDAAWTPDELTTRPRVNAADSARSRPP